MGWDREPIARSGRVRATNIRAAKGEASNTRGRTDGTNRERSGVTNPEQMERSGRYWITSGGGCGKGFLVEA